VQFSSFYPELGPLAQGNICVEARLHGDALLYDKKSHNYLLYYIRLGVHNNKLGVHIPNQNAQLILRRFLVDDQGSHF
jgi:hypothetical protein